MVLLFHAYTLDKTTSHELIDGFALHNLLFYSGIIGLTFFYTLSSHVLTLSFKRDPDYSPFLIRRIFRIFPLYYFNIICVIACYSLFNIKRFSFDLFSLETLRILTCTQIYNLTSAPEFINPVSWTLNTEWTLYLIFPVLYMLTRRFSLSAFLFIIFTYTASLYATNHAQFFFEFGRNIFPFYIGSLAAFYVNDNPRLSFSFLPKSLALLSIAALLLAMSNSYFIRFAGAHLPLFLAAFNGLTIIILSSLQKTDPIYGFFLESRVILFTGKISYSVYLFHLPIQIILTTHFKNLTFLQILASSLFITTLTSIASFYLIEKPFYGIGKKICNAGYEDIKNKSKLLIDQFGNQIRNFSMKS